MANMHLFYAKLLMGVTHVQESGNLLPETCHKFNAGLCLEKRLFPTSDIVVNPSYF